MEAVKIEFPCTECKKECTENTIQCETCEKWSHIDCYTELKGKTKDELDKLNFYCKLCKDNKKRKRDETDDERRERNKKRLNEIDTNLRNLSDDIKKLNTGIFELFKKVKKDKKFELFIKDDDELQTSLLNLEKIYKETITEKTIDETIKLFDESKKEVEGVEDDIIKYFSEVDKGKKKRSKSKRKKSKRKSLKKRK